MNEVVFHSSGTTGEPKKIVRDEAMLQADAKNLVAVFPEILNPTSVILASVRPEHMYGALWCDRVPRLAGARVIPEIVISVEALLSAPRGSLVFVTTPSFLEKAIAHPDFPSLAGAFRAIITSGSLLREETSKAVFALVGVSPLEIYGSTEAGSVAFRMRSKSDAWTLVPSVQGCAREDGRLVVSSPYAMLSPLVMDDLVHMTSERTFLLKGRTDRRVKVLESYVSLDAVERALLANDLVRHVRVEPLDEGRLGALVVLSEAGLKKASQEGTSAIAVILRSSLRSCVEANAMPRRIRVVRALPVNEQGKTTREAVQAVLRAWCREPLVTTWQASARALSACLVFPVDMECFKGHFPGFPILPGVAQLYFLRHFARAVFPDWPDAATFRRLKFQKVVRPFRSVTLSIARTDEGVFSFSITGEHGPCASGLVERTKP